MPNTIVEKAKAFDEIDEIESVEITSLETQESSELEYVVTGKSSQKLFGLFNLQLPTQLIFDVETGDFLETNQDFVTRVLNLFSF